VRGDSSLETPGHPRWLLLPLEGDVDVAATQVVEDLIGDVASRDFVEDTIAMVAGASRTVRQQSDELREQDVLTYAAFLLLPAPGLLLPGPVATLRIRPVSPADSDDDVLALCADLAGERHGQVDVDVVTTPSGRALSVRYRPVVEVEDGRVVNEHRLVLWPRREVGMLLELSLYLVDLVEGGAAAEPLRELAESIVWTVDEAER